MQDKNKFIRSKVKSRKGEKDGIFRKFVEEIDFLEYAKSPQSTHEQLVVERLEYLTKFALKVLRDRHGFTSWSEKVLMVSGVRQHIPEGVEIEHYRQQLSSEGLAVSYTTARSSFDDNLSFGNLANYLDKACGAVEVAIAKNDMFAAMFNLTRAEELYLQLHLLAMESDYVLGKSQRQTSRNNWDEVLRDWKAQRHRYTSDRACDRGMEKLSGIPKESIKSQRRQRGISGKTK